MENRERSIILLESNQSEDIKNKMFKDYIYGPGDILIEYWKVKGINVNIARYLIYDKEDVIHSFDNEIGYTTYKAYVLYTYDPYNREDRSGLLSVGQTYELNHWNDMDEVIQYIPNDGVEVVKSGLLWEDMD